MNILPVALVIFYKWDSSKLQVWVQRREDDGPFHGLLEFPGGKVEPGELPINAAVREVEEEVGIKIDPTQGKFMGCYPHENSSRTILLYVHLFPDQESIKGKGQWLGIEKSTLSGPLEGIIPSPNHLIIDDLFLSLYDNSHE